MEKPAQEKEKQEAPPTLPTLEMLLANGMVELVQEQIKKFKLQYAIHNGRLVDISSGLSLYLRMFITQDKDMLDMKEDLKKLSSLDYPVLVSGETGTGKEIVARILHGDRDPDLFIAVNCGGLPEHLIESELFGHVAGAFTGALTTKPGLMKLANGGTLFLDEIGELPLHVQAKFLRAIQEKVIRKVGGKEDERINCRIVCATNRNIKKMTEDGLFRKDLYARVSTFECNIKPLRDRTGDIALILESLDGGKELLSAKELVLSNLNLDLNVRSLQQHAIRYKILGKI